VPAPGSDLTLWGTRQLDRDRFIIRYDDAFAAVTAPSTGTTAGVRFGGRVFNTPFLLRFQHHRLISQREAGLGHQLRPRPRTTSGELRITPKGGWWGAVGSRTGRFRGWLDDDGTRYARFFLEDHRVWLRSGRDLQRESGTWRLWGGVTRTWFKGEGEVELWPFTPAIIDLIGPKRRGMGEADVDLVSAGLHWSPPNHDEERSFNIGLDLHALLSDAEAETWQPFLAGLGRTDIISHRLRLRSALVADLGIDLRFPLLGRSGIRVGVAQLVPLASGERMVSGSGTGGGGGGDRSGWGGMRWWFAIDAMDALNRVRGTERLNGGAIRPHR
jgi:hypothetical protein